MNTPHLHRTLRCTASPHHFSVAVTQHHECKRCVALHLLCLLLPFVLIPAACLAGFHGCQHGSACLRCLALSALHHELGLTAAYPINLVEEPNVGQLGDLADGQLFGVAVSVLAVSRYVAAKRVDPAAKPHIVHGLAPPGCGKTTVLNVTA